jgi:DNA repair exonuclease SbcCD nuclease subunit
MITFIGDIHLGVERTAHTTPAGRARLRRAVHELAFRLTGEESGAGSSPILLGDLFDKARNTDEVLVQGNNVASNCAAVLAGNHDLVNRDGAETSLSLLAKQRRASRLNLVLPNYSRPEAFHLMEDDGTQVIGVPYQPTQGAFLQALEHAKEVCSPAFSRHVLCLHCDYELGFEAPETVNILTRGAAEGLLEHFDYVFCGHEHNSRELFGGRLVMAGSIMPMSFSEMSDKFIWRLGDGKVEKVRVWSAEERYRSMSPCLGDGPVLSETLADGVQFVQISGTATASELADIYRTVQNWWRSSEDLIAVKLDVTTGSLQVDAKQIQPVSVRPMAETVERLLEGTDLISLWRDLHGEVA